MKPEKKISLLFLCVAMLIIAGCRKDDTPAEVKTPVGFRAMSQVVSVRAADDEKIFPYDDFGVWGIARQHNLIYTLWTENTLTKVFDPEYRIANKITIDESRTFTPSADAYWLNGYTYNFLAVAPYGDSGLTCNGMTTKEEQPTVANPNDYISFTYDLSGKYNPGTGKTPDYTFDLLGAAAQTQNSQAGRTDGQDLLFWHLLSKIKITVMFVDDKGVELEDGSELDKVVLSGVKSQGDYTISYAGTTANPHALNCSVTNHSKSTEFTFTSEPTLNILPQDISNFRLFLDFTLKVDGKDMNVQDFEIDLTPAKKKAEVVLESGAKISPYIFNNQYNWIVKISPKLGVSFKIEVAPWTSTPIKDSNNNDEFEII